MERRTTRVWATAVAIVIGLLAGAGVQRMLQGPHRPSARVQAILEGARFSDETDISDR